MPATSSDTQSVDFEHRLQLNLVDALLDAVHKTQDLEAVDEILGQFQSFSEAHFMAEQLLMRLHAYPHYYAHTTAHDDLMERCTRLRAILRDGDLSPLLTETQRLKDDLLVHMDVTDKALDAFLRDSSVR